MEGEDRGFGPYTPILVWRVKLDCASQNRIPRSQKVNKLVSNPLLQNRSSESMWSLTTGHENVRTEGDDNIIIADHRFDLRSSHRVHSGPYFYYSRFAEPYMMFCFPLYVIPRRLTRHCVDQDFWSRTPRSYKHLMKLWPYLSRCQNQTMMRASGGEENQTLP